MLLISRILDSGVRQNPIFMWKILLTVKKSLFWAALSSTGIIGPFFFEDTEGEAVTINSERYLKLMKSKFLPALRRKVVNFDDVWFQQDGATPHTAGCVLQWLDNTFGDQYISYRTANVWPPHTPDLNPLDFFLWGYLQDRVYSPSPQTTEDLKTATTREIRPISVDTCKAVIKKTSEIVFKRC